jgi:glutamyl-tRNA synthetase
VLLYNALGRAVPAFAHVPLILGPDKKRLSKRHGATAVGEYERAGYLSEAMVNFLALLGWSPGGDREVMTRDELIAAFAIEGINGGNAIFNVEKLDWFNAQHIARMPAEEIVRRVEPDLKAAGLWNDEFQSVRRAWLLAVVDLVKPRLRKLGEIVDHTRPFLADAVEPDPAAAAKYLGASELAGPLAALRERLARVEPFEPNPIEAALREVAAAEGVKAASLIHASRVAVTGQSVSPGVFEVLALAGRDRVLERLAAAERRVRDAQAPS